MGRVAQRLGDDGGRQRRQLQGERVGAVIGGEHGLHGNREEHRALDGDARGGEQHQCQRNHCHHAHQKGEQAGEGVRAAAVGQGQDSASIPAACGALVKGLNLV
ncbi:MAG: hypothetical protein ROW48_17335 [Bellilinea sp.]